MIRLRHVLLVGALLGLSTVSAQAGIVGSLSLSGQNIVPLTGDPLTTPSYTNTDTTAAATGSGIFGAVTVGTSFGSLTTDTGITPGFGFQLLTTPVGSFLATANLAPAYTTIGTSRYQNLSVSGTYTDLSNKVYNFVASVTYTQSSTGGQVSQAVSIDVFAIPEPSSVALGAIGLVSVGLVALRKRRSSK